MERRSADLHPHPKVRTMRSATEKSPAIVFPTFDLESHVPWGKPWDRQPVSGKVRRKLGVSPGFAARPPGKDAHLPAVQEVGRSRTGCADSSGRGSAACGRC